MIDKMLIKLLSVVVCEIADKQRNQHSALDAADDMSLLCE